MQDGRVVTSLLAAAALVVFALSPTEISAKIEKDRKLDEKKAEEEARPELDGESSEDFHRRQVDEGQKNLQEIQRLLDEIEKNLGAKQTGRATQQRQQEVVKRLEELIKHLSKG